MAKKGVVVIDRISDDRHFENKPSDPSTPSIDGDASTLGPEQKRMFIGRQRNTYGKAMGDIILAGGQLVDERTYELLSQGFARRGYEVRSQGPGGIHAQVSIENFWAWFTPGFATITFEARVACKVTLKRGDQVQTITVSGQGINHGQVASNANWALAYSRSFEDFLKNFETALAQAGY